ncbi:MAG: Gfo/Idh/MocA family protein [Anaerolineae bacterium]
MQKIRWGLLSTANINRRLIPAIRMSERGELVAVASRSEQSAKAYAQEWGIPQVFATYEAMLQSDAVDAVYISLPNHLHAHWSIYAMQQGKHVLCEKPFAVSMAEVDEMIAVSKSTGIRIAEAFMYRHHPQTKIAGEWVRNGRLGNIVLMRGVFNFKMRTRENVRLVPDFGGGCMWDVGVYPMSMAQFIMGAPPESAQAEQWIGPSGVDEQFNGQLNFSNGRMAQISSSFRTPWYTHVDILGTEGRLVLNRPFTGLESPDRRLMFYPAKGHPEKIPVPEEYLYLGEVNDMHAAILDGTPNYLTLSETRNHIRTTLALYKSAQNGRVVHLSEI